MNAKQRRQAQRLEEIREEITWALQHPDHPTSGDVNKLREEYKKVYERLYRRAWLVSLNS